MARKSKAEQQAARQQRQHLMDIDQVLSTPAGQRVIWVLLERTGVMRSSFHSDPLVMAMQEGQRNIGLRLTAEILEACPEKYINLLKSAKARREKANEETNHVVEVSGDDALAAGDGDHGGSR